ncbi:hypothetical protein MJT46_012891 [Ovis ammon polii x Ovis aries]|nr:hypothetical protein MJT46_012891 [Ovis ammon polii x Ovis aries]
MRTPGAVRAGHGQPGEQLQRERLGRRQRLPPVGASPAPHAAAPAHPADAAPLAGRLVLVETSKEEEHKQRNGRVKPVFQESSLYPNPIDLETDLSPPAYAHPPLPPQVDGIGPWVHCNHVCHATTEEQEKAQRERKVTPHPSNPLRMKLIH